MSLSVKHFALCYLGFVFLCWAIRSVLLKKLVSEAILPWSRWMLIISSETPSAPFTALCTAQCE